MSASRQPGKHRIYMNIGYELNEEQLRIFFSQFGNVLDVYVPKHKSGRNKGFGFTTFETEEQLLAALAQSEYTVFGSVVKINRAGPRPAAEQTPERQSGSVPAPISPPLTTPPAATTNNHGQGPRLYVGGIPDDVTEDDLRAHFSKWGQVVDCYFPGKKGPRRVNYCFVTFDHWRAAQRACSQSERNINGKPLQSISVAEERALGSSGGGATPQPSPGLLPEHFEQRQITPASAAALPLLDSLAPYPGMLPNSLAYWQALGSLPAAQQLAGVASQLSGSGLDLATLAKLVGVGPQLGNLPAPVAAASPPSNAAAFLRQLSAALGGAAPAAQLGLAGLTQVPWLDGQAAHPAALAAALRGRPVAPAWQLAAALGNVPALPDGMPGGGLGAHDALLGVPLLATPPAPPLAAPANQQQLLQVLAQAQQQAQQHSQAHTLLAQQAAVQQAAAQQAALQRHHALPPLPVPLPRGDDVLAGGPALAAPAGGLQFLDQMGAQYVQPDPGAYTSAALGLTRTDGAPDAGSAGYGPQRVRGRVPRGFAPY